VLRYEEAVRITNVVVLETFNSGHVLRIAARLPTAPTTDTPEVACVATSSPLKELDPKEWVILWEGKADKKSYKPRGGREGNVEVPGGKVRKFCPTLQVKGVVSNIIRIDIGANSPLY